MMDDDEFPPDEDELTEKFRRASEYAMNHGFLLKQEDLLYIYGRYKQATAGPCSIPMPGILKFRNRTKWSAWNSLGSMTKEEAMKQYIDKISTLNSDWDLSSTKEGSKKNYGPVNSSCVNTDPELKDESKTAFDFVKEGNLDKVRKLIQNSESAKSMTDENGLSLLHWACDRGHSEIVKFLISSGVDINAQDNDGQTSLHYASSCGHENVVKMLIIAGANVKVFDSDGLTPADVAYNAALKEILITPVEQV